MNRWLLTRIGTHTEHQRIFLELGDNIIGRGEVGPTITINSPFLSRKHCLIMVSEREVKIKDLKSSNGVFINKSKIPAERFVSVAVNDSIGIGSITNEAKKDDKLIMEFVISREVPQILQEVIEISDTESETEDERIVNNLEKEEEKSDIHVLEDLSGSEEDDKKEEENSHEVDDEDLDEMLDQLANAPVDLESVIEVEDDDEIQHLSQHLSEQPFDIEDNEEEMEKLRNWNQKLSQNSHSKLSRKSNSPEPEDENCFVLLDKDDFVKYEEARRSKMNNKTLDKNHNQKQTEESQKRKHLEDSHEHVSSKKQKTNETDSGSKKKTIRNRSKSICGSIAQKESSKKSESLSKESVKNLKAALELPENVKKRLTRSSAKLETSRSADRKSDSRSADRKSDSRSDVRSDKDKASTSKRNSDYKTSEKRSESSSKSNRRSESSKSSSKSSSKEVAKKQKSSKREESPESVSLTPFLKAKLNAQSKRRNTDSESSNESRDSKGSRSSESSNEAYRRKYESEYIIKRQSLPAKSSTSKTRDSDSDDKLRKSYDSNSKRHSLPAKKLKVTSRTGLESDSDDNSMEALPREKDYDSNERNRPGTSKDSRTTATSSTKISDKSSFDNPVPTEPPKNLRANLRRRCSVDAPKYFNRRPSVNDKPVAIRKPVNPDVKKRLKELSEKDARGKQTEQKEKEKMEELRIANMLYLEKKQRENEELNRNRREQEKKIEEYQKRTSITKVKNTASSRSDKLLVEIGNVPKKLPPRRNSCSSMVISLPPAANMKKLNEIVQKRRDSITIDNNPVTKSNEIVPPKLSFSGKPKQRIQHNVAPTYIQDNQKPSTSGYVPVIMEKSKVSTYKNLHSVITAKVPPSIPVPVITPPIPKKLTPLEPLKSINVVAPFLRFYTRAEEVTPNKKLKSCIKNTTSTIKKSVRFNENVSIKYIDSCLTPEDFHKEPVRLIEDEAFEIDGCWKQIVNEVTTWPPEDLESCRNYEIPNIGLPDQLEPCKTFYNSLSEYRSILEPLMKMELFAIIKNKYEIAVHKKTPVISLQIYDVTASNNNLNLHATSSSKLLSGFLIVGTKFEKSTGSHRKFLGYVWNAFFKDNMWELLIVTNHQEFLTEEAYSVLAIEIGYIRNELKNLVGIKMLKDTGLIQKILNPTLNVPYKAPITSFSGKDSLNTEQRDIIMGITEDVLCNSQNPNITVIEGGPGTGKTRTIVHMILEIFKAGSKAKRSFKILVCSVSNVCINEITESLLKKKVKCPREQNFDLVRTGAYDKMSAVVKNVSLKDKIRNASKENSNIHPDAVRKTILEKADIVCTTINSSYALTDDLKSFDICLIDEATQCTDAHIIIPLQLDIKKLVLIGDSNQLPALIQSQYLRDHKMNLSLFKRIADSFKNQTKSSPVYYLKKQYRMHPEILKFPNSRFYNNHLKNGNTYQDNILNPYMVFDLQTSQNLTQNMNRNIYNCEEIEFVVELLKIILEIERAKTLTYGIITPYSRNQAELRKHLERVGHFKNVDIQVYTIDSAQGLEKDVVILTTARTKGVGFLKNFQRINVALTRAKKAMYLCGNISYLSSEEDLWKQLESDAKQRKRYQAVFDSGSENEIRNAIRADTA